MTPDPAFRERAAVADAAAAYRSAYVHVPFCRRRCPYCDFAVVAMDEVGERPDVHERYTDALVAEIGRERAWESLDAVNLGGGTPSALPAPFLARILTALGSRFGFAAGAEVSLEVNPEDWTPQLAAEVRALGFTRTSLGVQSFDAATLAALGRLHTPDEAIAAFAASRLAGYESVSIDLIYGTPGETLESWARTVDTALDLQPDHLSAYALTVERGTALSRAVRAGAAAPDPDDQADKYELLLEAAASAGLQRYEVSNFARPGHECRYNLGTWAQAEYAGFGLGAHSHRGGSRWSNVRKLDAYLARVEAGSDPGTGHEDLDTWGRERERLFLGLRRAVGAVAGPAGEALVAGDAGKRLVSAGVIVQIDDRLVVAKPLLTDEVNRAVLSVSPRDC